MTATARRDDIELLSDDELARWSAFYATRLALVDEEVTAGRPGMTAAEYAALPRPWQLHFRERGWPRALSREELRDNTAAFFRVQLDDLAHEEGRRLRAAERGVARDGSRLPDDLVAEIKRRIRLDGAVENETRTRLGKLTAGKTRSGPCPFCPSSDAFTVYLADPDDEHFHCYSAGCGAHGDVLDLTRRVYGVAFREAVTILAAYCGLPWPPAPPAPAGRPRPPDYLAAAREAARG